MKKIRSARSTTRAPAFQRYNPAIASRPVRKVITKRTQRVIGYFSSVKMGGLVPWESQLEYDQLCLLEVANSVTEFFVQPEVFPYEYGGERRRYYPDIRVEDAAGETRMLEVKYQSDADDPENQELFDIFRDIYSRRGLRFEVRTELVIRRQPDLANAKLMLEDRDRAPSERLRLATAEAFAVRRPSTLGDLEAALGRSPTRRGDLFGMALRGHFDIDITSAPLTGDSRVSVRAESLAQGDDVDVQLLARVGQTPAVIFHAIVNDDGFGLPKTRPLAANVRVRREQIVLGLDGASQAPHERVRARRVEGDKNAQDRAREAVNDDRQPGPP